VNDLDVLVKEDGGQATSVALHRGHFFQRLRTDTKTSAAVAMASLLISLVRIPISNEVYSLKSYEAE
jgi:hypothetical protein